MSFNIVQNADGSTDFISALTGLRAMRLRPYQGFYPSPDKIVSFTDHFLGDLLKDEWSGAKGSDGTAVVPSVVSGAIGGHCKLKTGAAGSGMAADGSSLTHGLNWRASNGGLYVEAKVMFLSSVANVALNFGFTDALATGTLEMPITLSTGTLTTNATDGAVFVFDTAATNDTFHLQGVKNNTDTALLNSTVAPVADTWLTLGLAIDAAGTASFYINDVLKGSVANALTTSVALTPVVCADSRTSSASKEIIVDYVHTAMIVA